MTSTEGFQGASYFAYSKASYLIDDVEYKQNAKTFAVTDSARQICRHPVFGKHQVDIGLIRFNNGKTKPISGASDDHMSWFQAVIAPKTPMSFQLTVAGCRHYSGSGHPRNALSVGTSGSYCGTRPSTTDWMVFETLTVNAIPTSITLMNYAGLVMYYLCALSELRKRSLLSMLQM